MWSELVRRSREYLTADRTLPPDNRTMVSALPHGNHTPHQTHTSAIELGYHRICVRPTPDQHRQHMPAKDGHGTPTGIQTATPLHQPQHTASNNSRHRRRYQQGVSGAVSGPCTVLDHKQLYRRFILRSTTQPHEPCLIVTNP